MFYKNYIEGQWIDSATGKTFKSINPADTSDELGEFPASNAQDVERAVQAAERAFREWSKVPAPKRGELLFEIGERFKRHKEDLAQIMTREMGKVLKEARGDVQEAIDMAYYIAAEGRRLFGYTTPSELSLKHCISFRRPVGVVGVITPWNFPVAIPAWKIFPAILAGNTVVWKPATDTPRCAYEFVKILEDAGLPKGVVNLVFGGGNDVGIPLAKHPKVARISFTGSTETGREIYKYGAEKLAKVHLEMGGKNPIIVLEDADLDLAVDGILWSAFGTTGQRCTACSRLIIEDGVYEKLLEKLVERTKRLRLGNGLNPNVDVGPVVNRASLERIARYVELGVKEGAKLLCGGQIAKDGDLAKGFFFQPTIFADVTPTMRIFQEEIFGPVLAVTKAKDFEDAIALANNTSYGLSSSIYTKDVFKAHRAMDEIEAGITYINSGTIGAEVHLPFGGIKNTGNGGRESGWTAIDEYTEWKTIYIDFSGRLQKAQGID